MLLFDVKNFVMSIFDAKFTFYQENNFQEWTLGKKILKNNLPKFQILWDIHRTRVIDYLTEQLMNLKKLSHASKL